MMSKQILIVAPSLSPARSNLSLYKNAERNLEKFGYKVKWAPKARQALEQGAKDRFESMPLKDKLSDFNWAINQDAQVIMAAVGGYDCYQLLHELNFKQMATKNKILVGHSDPTLLLNSYYQLTGKSSWYGTNLRNIGDADTGEMSAASLADVLTGKQVTLKKSNLYKDSLRAQPRKVRNWQIIQGGIGEGTGIGGNIGTFYLLQGTRYMPDLSSPFILFLEEDEMPGKYAIREFDRRIRSILDQPGAKQNIRGLLIGRFLDVTQTRLSDLSEVISNIASLKDKPVIANVEFGHGMPRILLPVGGTIKIDTTDSQRVVINL